MALHLTASANQIKAIEDHLNAKVSRVKFKGKVQRYYYICCLTEDGPMMFGMTWSPVFKKWGIESWGHTTDEFIAPIEE